MKGQLLVKIEKLCSHQFKTATNRSLLSIQLLKIYFAYKSISNIVFNFRYFSGFKSE